MRLAVNIAGFYAGWFATILAAAAGHGAIAVAASLAVVAVHLALAPRRSDELKLVVAGACVGLVAEALLISSDVARYALPNEVFPLPPWWLVAIWMAFATTMNVSLGWLKEHGMLAAILGLLVAPASYYAGARLGAMSLAEPIAGSLALIGGIWAVAFPLLIALARRWDGK